MNLDEFVHRRQPRWVELDGAVRRRGRHVPADRLLALHRAVSADLAFARQHFGGTPMLDELVDLHAASHQLLYGNPALRVRGVPEAIRRYGEAVRESWRALTIATGVVLAAAIAGAWWARVDLDAATALLPPDLHRRLLAGEPAMVIPPAAVAVAVAGSWLAGVGALPGLVWVGAAIGVSVTLAVEADQFTELSATFPPLLLIVGGLALTCGPAAEAGVTWARRRPVERLTANAAMLTGGGVALMACGLVVHRLELEAPASVLAVLAAAVLTIGPVALVRHQARA